MSSAPFGFAFAKLGSEVCQIFIPLKCTCPLKSANLEKCWMPEISILMEEKSICPNPTESPCPTTHGRARMDLPVVHVSDQPDLLSFLSQSPDWIDDRPAPLEPMCLKAQAGAAAAALVHCETICAVSQQLFI